MYPANPASRCRRAAGATEPAISQIELSSHYLDEKTRGGFFAGPADYVLRVVYRDAADFERIHTRILTQLPGVMRVQSALALRTVKRTAAVPI